MIPEIRNLLYEFLSSNTEDAEVLKDREEIMKNIIKLLEEQMKCHLMFMFGLMSEMIVELKGEKRRTGDD